MKWIRIGWILGLLAILEPAVVRGGQEGPKGDSDSIQTESSPPRELRSNVDPDPRPGVLLLRNGEVLEGKIVRVGDFYYVAVPHGQVRIRATDVETVCRTLQEGYRFKRQNIQLPSAQQHLELGQWCIRHGLVAEAEQELVEAVRLQPDHPLVPLLQRRIQMAQHPAEPSACSEPEASLPAESYELEYWVQTLPPVVVEEFTQSVQPILLNNCTKAGCHGPKDQGRFSLLKPPSGRLPTRRLTQRNLASTFRWINAQEPLRSPLLAAPLAPHGSVKIPIFGNPHCEAYQRLVRWVLLAAQAASQPGGLAQTSSQQTFSPPSFPGIPTGWNEPLGKKPPTESASAEPAIPAGADPEVPKIVRQAGLWQPVPGATPAQGPLLEVLNLPPSGPAPEGGVPSSFLPWAPATPRSFLRPEGASQAPSSSPSVAGGRRGAPPGINKTSSPANETSTQQPAAPRSAGSVQSGCPAAPNLQETLSRPASSYGFPYSAPSGRLYWPRGRPGSFSRPHRSEPKRGDPTAGQFRPVDPFDPEIFNRQYHSADSSSKPTSAEQ